MPGYKQTTFNLKISMQRFISRRCLFQANIRGTSAML